MPCLHCDGQVFKLSLKYTVICTWLYCCYVHVYNYWTKPCISVQIWAVLNLLNLLCYNSLNFALLTPWNLKSSFGCQIVEYACLQAEHAHSSQWCFKTFVNIAACRCIFIYRRSYYVMLADNFKSCIYKCNVNVRQTTRCSFAIFRSVNENGLPFWKTCFPLLILMSFKCLYNVLIWSWSIQCKTCMYYIEYTCNCF